MEQSLIVALIVAAAIAYSAWILMPASWRRAAATRLARRVGRSGVASRHKQAVLHRLERAGGCSECASCKGCASSSPVRRV